MAQCISSAEKKFNKDDPTAGTSTGLKVVNIKDVVQF